MVGLVGNVQHQASSHIQTTKPQFSSSNQSNGQRRLQLAFRTCNRFILILHFICPYLRNRLRYVVYKLHRIVRFLAFHCLSNLYKHSKQTHHLSSRSMNIMLLILGLIRRRIANYQNCLQTHFSSRGNVPNAIIQKQLQYIFLDSSNQIHLPHNLK